jgi:hypothetical protein
MANDPSLAGRFAKLDALRQAHLNRARYCSELTIPSLLPKQGSDENTPLPTPYQGLGARCVNNLASKLLLTLFPPNSPFLKMAIRPDVLERLKEQLGDDKFKTDVETKMATVERRIAQKFETDASRVQAFRILRLCVCTGDVLLEFPKTGGLRYFRLDKYVVRRTPSGDPIEILIKEKITMDEIPEGVAATIKEKHTDKDAVETVDLITQYRLQGNPDDSKSRWKMTQECGGVMVSGVSGDYPKDECPVIPLPWTLADGENYGRGHVEEYLGDLISLESLTKSIVEGSAAAARILFLCDPNGSTNPKDLEDVPNGGATTGNKDDITVLQLEKYGDFRIAAETIDKLERRLSMAFLLQETVQRQAERVTAQEIQYMAQQLEDSLGGIYSVLAQSFQMPLARRYLKRMSSTGEIPKFPTSVEVMITTGFEALGRGHDLAKLQGFLNDLMPLKELLLGKVRPETLVLMLANARGVDTSELLKTAEQEEAEANAEKETAMAAELGPAMINQMGGIAKANAGQTNTPN